MLSRLDRLAYRSQHLGFLINATVLQEAARLVTRTPRPKVDATQLRALLRRRDELHARDLANVDAGLYPRELLFDLPVRQYMRALPQLMRDTPNVVRRMRRAATTRTSRPSTSSSTRPTTAATSTGRPTATSATTPPRSTSSAWSCCSAARPM